MKRNARKSLIVVVFILLSLIPMIPFSVVPPMTMLVVDDLDNPIADMTIEQSWRHNSYQFIDGVDQVRSNKNGIAEFPERIEYFSLVQITFGLIFRAINFLNPHASYGPSGLFLPRGNVSGWASYRPDQPLPTKIVVKR